MSRSGHELPQDWEAHEPYSFSPIAAQYETVKTRQDLPPETAIALQGMIDVFRGDAPAVRYWQLPRMGRACFTPVSPESTTVISPKGALGRSPGSESVQRLQNTYWHSLLGEAAGWTTLNVTDEVAFMVLCKPSDDELKPDSRQVKESLATPMLTYAMPAGYSPFRQLLREHRALEHLIEPAGVLAFRSLALLRREVPLPWTTMQEGKQYLTAAFTKDQQLVDTGVVPQEAPSYRPYARLDSGLLFRLFKTAVRPQDNYDRAIEGGWKEVRNALKAAPYSSEDMLFHLASAAGKLVEHGIIHGQLYYDYQNITTAGEVCDVELTVVAPSVNPALATQFTNQLSHDEAQYDVEMVENYEANIQQMAPDNHSAGRSLLEQCYYLFDAVVRSVDIAQRALSESGNRNAPGTVLSTSHVHELRQRFASLMADNIGSRGRHVLASACRAEVDIDTDFMTPGGTPFLRWVLDGNGSTIYGWTDPSRPFNNHGHITSREDIEFVVDDFGKFARTILAQIGPA